MPIYNVSADKAADTNTILQTGNYLSAFIKPLVALLITILIFAGFTFLADIEVLDFIQTRFYNPSAVNSHAKENAIDCEIAGTHINDLYSKFELTLTEPAIRSSFLYNQSADDIYERSRIYGILMESTGGLQSIQFVDNNGIRLHYSTSARDIMSQSQTSTAYRNYNEDQQSLPYETVSVHDGSEPKIVMDERGDRIIFSFPFHDSMDVYRGTALFSVSINAFAQRLIAQGRLKVNDSISVIGEPAGILLGCPETSRSVILRRVSEIWSESAQNYVTLDAEDSGIAFSLISGKTNQGIFFGRLVNSYLFSISEPMKLILQVSAFLTFFLALFFLLNIKPNPVTVVRNRVRRLRDNLFEQLYVNKSGQERLKWILELEQRRDEIRTQLKRGLRLRKRLEANVNGIIDKSWDELLAILKVDSGILSVVQPSARTAVREGDSEEAEVEELLEEVESLEEIDEAEEIEEIEEAEALEEAELDEIEEIEEIEEAEEIEELDEIEEAGDLDELIEEPEEINIIDAALREAIEPTKPEPRGLLWLAGKFAKDDKHTASQKGLLWQADQFTSRSAHKGLYWAANKKAKDLAKEGKLGKGLLALANEVAEDDVQVLIEDVSIVSPFSSMFSSLEDDSKD
ncbi:MAG: hypothetical protein FWB77_04070 [Treponema sp.]|nr:hypothetical protein [Treponema sp.]